MTRSIFDADWEPAPVAVPVSDTVPVEVVLYYTEVRCLSCGRKQNETQDILVWAVQGKKRFALPRNKTAAFLPDTTIARRKVLSWETIEACDGCFQVP